MAEQITQQEPQPSPAIRSYDIPNFDEMPVEQVEKARNKILADAAGDRFHPYFGSHPQSKEMKAAISRSFEITSDGLTHTERAMKEAMEHGEQKRAKQAKAIYDSAVADAAAYEQAGGEHLEIPVDIQQGQAKCLRMLRLCQEGNFDDIVSMIQSSGRELNLSASTIQGYVELTQSENFSKELKQNFIENILADMSVQFKKKSVLKKTEIDRRPNYMKKTGRTDWVL